MCVRVCVCVCVFNCLDFRTTMSLVLLLFSVPCSVSLSLLPCTLLPSVFLRSPGPLVRLPGLRLSLTAASVLGRCPTAGELCRPSRCVRHARPRPVELLMLSPRLVLFIINKCCCCSRPTVHGRVGCSVCFKPRAHSVMTSPTAVLCSLDSVCSRPHPKTDRTRRTGFVVQQTLHWCVMMHSFPCSANCRLCISHVDAPIVARGMSFSTHVARFQHSSAEVLGDAAQCKTAFGVGSLLSPGRLGLGCTRQNLVRPWNTRVNVTCTSGHVMPRRASHRDRRGGGARSGSASIKEESWFCVPPPPHKRVN